MDGQSTSGGTCCNSQHDSNISSSSTSSSSSSGGGATVSDDSTTLFHDNNNPLLYLSSSSSSSSHHPHYHSSRRCFLTNHAAAAVTMSPFILYPKESFAKGDIASTPQQGQESRLVESIRQSAAKLPGYGTPDVYYPPSFLGQWRATRTIVSTSLLEGWWSSTSNPLFLFSPSSSSREQLILSSFMKMPFVLTYNVRFIAVGGGKSEAVLSSSSSWNDFQVIADRAYNAASFHNALTSKLEEHKEETGTGELKDDKDRLVLLSPSIQKIDWSPSNPNTCTMYYGDGSWKELRVTKRATELDVERGTVFSSEYQRISTISSSSSSSVNGGTVGGIPSVEAVRVMTKWKMQEKEKEEDEEEGRRNPQVVEGIEIVYLDDTAIMGGGTAFTTPSASSANAKVVMKSRLRLERIV